MDKSYITGIALMAVIFTVFIIYTQQKQKQYVEQNPPVTETVPAENSPASPSAPQPSIPAFTATEEAQIKDIRIETDQFLATLTTLGAELTSIKLKNHTDGETPVEMVASGDSGLNAFSVYLGDSLGSGHIDIPFHYEKVNELTHRFSVNLDFNGESLVTLRKTFVFSPDEYMIEVRVAFINSEREILNLNHNGTAYTLVYGPQIGPEALQIGKGRMAADYRNYRYFDAKKNRNALNKKTFRVIEEPIKWAAVMGKYFTVMGLPARDVVTTFSNDSVSGLEDSSFLLFMRRGDKITTSEIEDIYRFYIGPKIEAPLRKYDKAENNAFGVSGAQLTKITGNSPLYILEVGIKRVLQFLYINVVANYGICIIILAFLIKILLYPLTHKSYQSTRRMQEIQPQMKAIQDKYKGDPQKLQMKMGELYKKEGVNPMGGCLPMLLQMPVIIALANLFYKYFDFWGASFIPGWIDDLSAPEAVYTIFLPFTIPLLNMDTIPLRVLPIIYLCSQLLMSKTMQPSNATGQSQTQMRMLTLYMPIMFFFILYNMPSGLIMYWTVSNLLTMIQQHFISKHKHSNPPGKAPLQKKRLTMQQRINEIQKQQRKRQSSKRR